MRWRRWGVGRGPAARGGSAALLLIVWIVLAAIPATAGPEAAGTDAIDATGPAPESSREAETPEAPAAAGTLRGRAALDEAVHRIDAGELQAAVALLAAVAQGDTTKEDRLRAELLTATCYYGMGDSDAVRAALERALAIDPNVEPDPLEVPPALIDQLDSLRRALLPKVSPVVTNLPGSVSFSPAAPRPSSPFERPWYRRWSTWALAGVAVAGIVLATRDRSSPPRGANILVTPLSVDFGSLEQGSRATRRVTVTNTGEKLLQIDDVTTDPVAVFERADETCIGTTLDNGDVCTVDVRFLADTIGSYEGALSIVSNDEDAPRTIVRLQGEVTKVAQPILRVEPDALELVLELRPLGDVTVFNDGDAILRWVPPEVVAGRTFFRIRNSNACGAAALDPSASCTFSVECTDVRPDQDFEVGIVRIATSEAGTFDVSLTCKQSSAPPPGW